MININKNGFYEMDEEIYHSDPVPGWSLSSSGAKELIKKTPFHYWHRRTNPGDYRSTHALKFGSAAHCLLLEPEKFEQNFHILPDGFHRGYVKKWENEIREEKEAVAAGKASLTGADFERVQKVADGMAAEIETLKLFKASEKEKSGFWLDKEFEVWRRVRFDFYPQTGSIFGDYKTTEDLSDDAIQKSITNYGWHQQAAWYLDAANVLGHRGDNCRFIFFVQEKSAPFSIRVIQIDDASLEAGRMLNRKALDLFKRGIETGVWPGWDYNEETGAKPSRPAILGLSNWAWREIDHAAENGDLQPNYLTSIKEC